MSFKTCRHIMENGHFCNSPAVSKREFCYFHLEFRARRLKMARTRARGEQWWLDMPAIEDMRSCQAATVRVIEAIAAKLIEPDYAKLLLSSLRLAASNFKARKAWGLFSDYAIKGEFGFVGSYPNFEAVHDLPKTLDLDEDPLKLFPMPEAEPAGAPLIPSVGMSGSSTDLGSNSQQRTAKSGSATSAPLHPSFGPSGSSTNADLTKILEEAATPLRQQVTAVDVEIWDILTREGSDAAAKRGAELAREERRRDRRLQRARYEEMARNRNLQLAAQRIAGDLQKAQSAAAAAQAAVVEPQFVPKHAQPETVATAEHAPASERLAPTAVISVVRDTVDAANRPSPAGAATTMAQDVAEGGILGEFGDRAESRSDGTTRKPPQKEITSRAGEASKGAR